MQLLSPVHRNNTVHTRIANAFRNWPYAWRKESATDEQYGGPNPFSEPQSRLVSRQHLNCSMAAMFFSSSSSLANIVSIIQASVVGQHLLINKLQVFALPQFWVLCCLQLIMCVLLHGWFLKDCCNLYCPLLSLTTPLTVLCLLATPTTPPTPPRPAAPR